MIYMIRFFFKCCALLIDNAVLIDKSQDRRGRAAGKRGPPVSSRHVPLGWSYFYLTDVEYKPPNAEDKAMSWSVCSHTVQLKSSGRAVVVVSRW